MVMHYIIIIILRSCDVLELSSANFAVRTFVEKKERSNNNNNYNNKSK